MTRTVLLDWQTQTAPNFLAFFGGAGGFVQRANLKNIWIIPTFTQCRMRKNKPQFRFKRQQFFLIFHNQLISFIVSLAFAIGIFQAAFVLGKITAMHIFRIFAA